MTAPLITKNGPPAAPSIMPQKTTKALLPSMASIMSLNAKKNVLKGFSDKFHRNTESVRTIVRRFMTYEPCPEHMNNGLGGSSVPNFSKYTWYEKAIPDITTPNVNGSGSIPPYVPPTGTTVPEPIYIQGDGDCSEWTFPPEAKKYEELYRSASAKYNVPLCILVECSRQESQFNPNAANNKRDPRNPNYAQGIMQIVPVSHPTVKDPYDPQEAIPYGAKYLAEQHTSFGSWDKALAAYNWGPGNIRKFLKAHDGLLVISDLPAETAHYVPTILGMAKYNADVPVNGASSGAPVVSTNPTTPPIV